MKCFACDRPLKKGYCHAHTIDDQQVLVGSECAKNMPMMCQGKEMGWQPSKGGPRLYVTMLNPCDCHNELIAQTEK